MSEVPRALLTKLPVVQAHEPLSKRLSNYDVPNDVELPRNNLYLEKKRGDILNRLAYGLLTASQKEKLFTYPSDLPVTYPTTNTFRNDLEAILDDLPSVLFNTSSVSIPAVRTLCDDILAKFPSPFAEARLRGLILDLADECRWLGRDDLLVSASEKLGLEDGLSPVFHLNEYTEFTAFIECLNDRAFLSNVRGPREDDVLTIAISYKHEPHLTHKLSPSHLHEIATAVPFLAQELDCERYQIWIDRILSAKNRPDDRSWWKRGLAPFLQLPVLYVSGTDRSDDALIREMNTMWINIERVAAYIGRGMISYGNRFDRYQLPLHGINFENPRISRFDWWICSDDQHSLESNFKSLLLPIGSTEMLQRDTYFVEDRDELLREARRIFCNPREVVTTRAVSNYVMRDGVLWYDRETPTWLGAREWCASFVEDETCDEAGTLVDCAEPLGGVANVEFRRFEVADEQEEEIVAWVVVCPKYVDPSVALAVQIKGNSTGLRGLVAIDSPLEFLQWSSTELHGIDGIEENLPELVEMLRNSCVASMGARVCSVCPLGRDEDLLTNEWV